MPGPPPPPPPMAPPPMMPPPAPFMQPKGSDDRAALLKSIQKGAKLKKTVTNDKSAPVLGGKISNNTNNTSLPSGGGGGGFGTNSSSAPAANGLNLGGLFSGGMPKLKATGMLNNEIGSNNSNHNNSNSVGSDRPSANSIRRKPDPPPQPTNLKTMTSVQNELKKQMASDSKNRGPPPPAPVRNLSGEEPTTPRQPAPKVTTSNGFHPNPSTLHRKAKSNVHLPTLDTPEPSPLHNGYLTQPPSSPKPVIHYRKPNLAPKPPVLNGKPATPPKKLLVNLNGKPISRAQSMKSPRSPSPQSPDTNSAIKFGTVRNLSSVISQSLSQQPGNLNSRPRPMLNGRPTAPPPSVPSPTPSLSKNSVRPPNHAPPPPPPPTHAPPPPPHRTLSHQPSRAPPAIPVNNSTNNANAPPPPPRHSSMKGSDFDEKFKHKFHHPSTFPKPPPYKHCLKLYNNRQAGSKQQAPRPPQLQNTVNKTWDVPTSC